MKKVIRNGKVAVIYARRGEWYDQETESLLFHPMIVKLIEENCQHKITTKLLEKLFGVKAPYIDIDSSNLAEDGNIDLSIEWIPIGKRFLIDNKGYKEKVVFVSDMDWIKA